LKLEGQRDHVLLAFLYNTGARIQEALDLSVQALRLESPFQVRLFGKGRKERICPLWPETVELLKALLKESLGGKMNHLREPVWKSLKASGVRFKLKQYARRGGQEGPLPGQQANIPTQVQARHGRESCHGRGGRDSDS